MTKTKRAALSGAMTAHEVADTLRARLTPILSGYVWHVSGPGSLSPSVHVAFSLVPKGSSELDALNARVQAMISISARAWDRSRAAANIGPVNIMGRGPASYPIEPSDSVTAAQFRGTRGLLRARTASPEKIVEYVVASVEKAVAAGRSGGTVWTWVADPDHGEWEGFVLGWRGKMKAGLLDRPVRAARILTVIEGRGEALTFVAQSDRGRRVNIEAARLTFSPVGLGLREARQAFDDGLMRAKRAAEQAYEPYRSDS